jgi:hypothetical protein
LTADESPQFLDISGTLEVRLPEVLRQYMINCVDPASTRSVDGNLKCGTAYLSAKNWFTPAIAHCFGGRTAAQGSSTPILEKASTGSIKSRGLAGARAFFGEREVARMGDEGGDRAADASPIQKLASNVLIFRALQCMSGSPVEKIVCRGEPVAACKGVIVIACICWRVEVGADGAAEAGLGHLSSWNASQASFHNPTAASQLLAARQQPLETPSTCFLALALPQSQ